MKNIRKAVITAAGRGTRQYPASKTVQKELFPLVDTDGFTKPVLQIIVEEALNSGIDEICIITNPDNDASIRAHFKGLSTEQFAGQFKGKAWAIPLSNRLEDAGGRISYVIQMEQNGFGDAVYQARFWAGQEPFVLLVGDHVYLSDDPEFCTLQLIKAAGSTDAEVVSGVMAIPEAEIYRYGIVAGTDRKQDSLEFKIAAMSEKPAVEFARSNLRTSWLPDGSYYSFFGIHVLPPTLFECIEYLIKSNIRVKGEIQLTSALEMLLDAGSYVATEVRGTPHDMGIPEGLIETQIALALRSPYKDLALRHLSST